MREIKYDRIDCSRCGGTGHYSYNAMDGTICFKCRGAKKTLSHPAAKSLKLVEGFKVGLLSTSASEIEVGDAFKSINSNRRYAKVIEVRPVETNGSKSLRDGEMIPLLALVVMEGETQLAMNFAPEDPVLRFPDHDEFTEMMEFARDLPGVTVIDEEGATK